MSDAPMSRALTSSDAAAEAEAARIDRASERVRAQPSPVIQPMGERMAALEAEMRAELRSLDRRVTAHGAQLDHHGARIDGHGAQLADHGPRVVRLERIVEQVLAQLAALGLRLSKVELRVLGFGGLVYVVVEVVLRLAFGK